ncbi:hypothetical protein NFI00_000200 [Salmonella enterica]|nr:hypothetical protein [Salmonella enterica subsp. enterica serovar Minnesota]EJI5696497.1 hypothetical protein [Salmonella enterica]
MPNQSQAPQVAGNRVALVLQVNHLEAIEGGFESGLPFTLVYENTDVIPSEEARALFLKSTQIIQTTEYGYDYAVYRVIPENIEVLVGPGDFIVVFEDRTFSAFVGAGGLKVVNHPDLGDIVTVTRD